ncbi:hypothetical protein XI03_20610 [Bradyrhizobium sp. CCBAU 65884]|uniref:hypothetical protein n=1 Tax=Bradyrhizobium sp. CCBAU 65884 TaxID=722477 RepID=UPI00230534E8|nr:hypothetical protein [Bradyrhizobium sp. CCBAU 65884]MDA9476851.1 hypothetical protein [Bradyrhizobium sp. CCBAU 65884]
MSTLLTVNQAILAVRRICIEGGFLDETAANRKQGSPGKGLGFTKRFIGIVVTKDETIARLEGRRTFLRGAGNPTTRSNAMAQEYGGMSHRAGLLGIGEQLLPRSSPLVRQNLSCIRILDVGDRWSRLPRARHLEHCRNW